MQFSHTEERRSLRGLTPSGRMLLEAMRHAPSGAAATLACFVEVCGDKQARPCFVVFLQIVHGLALYGRRRMRVGTAAWPILTPDEVALLKCIDTAIDTDDAGLLVHVEWVVRRHGAKEFASYLRTLATLLPEPLFDDACASAIPAVDDDMALAGGRAGEKAGREWPASAFPAAIK